MQLNCYLNFDGRCEEAFKFYEQCLGGKIEFLMKFGESPMAADVSPEWKDKVIHASIKIEGQLVLMGADCPPEHFREPQGFSVSIALKDEKKAENIFQALSEGGKVTMPFQKTFWSVGFGMLVDRFSIPWMVNCEQAA